MKPKFYISTFLLFFSLFLMAQSSHYYYYKGQKKYLTLDKSSADINVKSTVNKSSLKDNYKLKDFTLEDDNSLNKPSIYKYAKITFQNRLTEEEYFEKLKLIKSRSDVRTVSPNFKGSDGKKIGMSDYLYVKLKKTDDYQILISLASEKKVSIIEQNKFMPLWYTLRCNENTNDNTLQIANYFFETGLFASAIPDLLVDDLILCANDTNFGDLWGLNNSSNPNIDINACNAWSITQGNGVNVAVLDQGIELTHNDLQSNISQNSFDTESNSSPSQIFGNHGTHVAGTVAAIKDNNLQVVGVAPQSTLISISNSLAGTPNSRIRRADGINWAWQNGADVINNSWSSAVQYDVIDDAIENALNNGRNGLGTIVVFASGNDFGEVGYPANSNSNILAVGSITSAGNRSNFSNFGNELDVVAPGSAILSTINSNGTDTFNGTSMAAPHVAGVVALILSVNPNLTVQEVNTIIESTAQKIGGYSYSNNSNRSNGTWNNEMGYGLVDAYSAVQMAQQADVNSSNLVGVKKICNNSTTTYNLIGGENTVSWNVSSNLQIVSSNNTSITVKHINSTSTNQGFVKAVLPNKTIRKAISIIKKPKITFPNTDLTNVLLNGGGSVDYETYIINQGDILPFSLNEYSASLSWKNTRPSNLSELNNPNGEIILDSNTLPPNLPYNPCAFIDSNGNVVQNSNSLVGNFQLIDSYFNTVSNGAVSYSSSPRIQFSSSGLLEIELTASNECGCDTKANSYIALPKSNSANKFKTSFSMSPNPANSFVNISIKVPERENVILGFPDLETGQSTFVEIGSQHGDIEYSYSLSVYNLISGNVIYTEDFDLVESDPNFAPNPFSTSNNEKLINLNTSDFVNGIYIVRINSLTENGQISRKLIINR